jgi:nitrogen regulatory protein P-II 1
MAAEASVKQVVAIVKPYLAERVLQSLRRAPLEALSVAEVKGFGRQKSYLDEYAKTEYAEVFLPKVEITMWVDDTRVEEVLRKLVAVARSGRMGDGKIFVMPVDHFC